MKKGKLLILIGMVYACMNGLLAQCPSASFTTTAPACAASGINFTNTSGNTGAGWTYFWDFDYPNGGGATPATSTAQNPTAVTYTAGGNGVYTVAFTITNTGMGCSSTVLMNIDIRTARADFSASKNNTCVGDSVLFYPGGTLGSSPNAIVTHYWSFGSGASPSTSNSANPPQVQYTTPGVKVITHSVSVDYTPCGGGVRNDLQTYTLTVNPSPTPNFSSNAPACQNSPVNFTYTGGGGSTFSWDFGQNVTPQISNGQNPSGITYSTAGTKTITLNVTNVYGCAAGFTSTITINNTPLASFASTAPACTGIGVNFTSTGTTSGVTYAWGFGAGVTPAASIAQNPAGVIYSTAGTKVVSYTVTNTASSCSSINTQTLNINQTPAVSLTSNAPKCAGSGVNFTNTGSTGNNWSYSWSFGTGAMPATSSSQNPSGVMYASGGSKLVTLTITNGICTRTDTASILINSLPVANAGKDTTICANASVSIGSAAVSGNTYSWFPVNTLSSATAANPTASPIAPFTQYIVTVTNTVTGCVNRDTADVTMLAPLVANAGPDGKICRNDSIQIGAGLIKGQKYTWTPSAGLNSANSPNPMASPSVTTSYTLSVTGSGCPSVLDEVTISVYQLPQVEAGNNDTITVGSSVQLTASGALQYTWTPAAGLNNVGIYNPIANPTITTFYIVNGMDIHGCANSDTVKVMVLNPSFWAPTAFTPDGNGHNDIFYVRGEGIQNFELRIFNRWGEEIFYTKDITQGWDGKRQLGGENMQEGAYLYNVRGTMTNGTAVNVKDLVNLIR